MNAIVGFSNLMNTDIELSKAERENFTELNELISTIYQTFQVLMPENVELRMQVDTSDYQLS